MKMTVRVVTPKESPSLPSTRRGHTTRKDPPARVDPPGRFTVAEFFAGIGLVRMGLEDAGFQIVWANDIEADKKEMYRGHFGTDDDSFHLQDIATVQAADLPPSLSLAWASFPCTDLSLAGGRSGLAGKQSGTFWHFVRILEQMPQGSRPPVVAMENVVGLATSHKGADLTAAIKALNDLDYSVDVLTLDGRRFVPQSRPRLFIVGLVSPQAEKQEDNEALRPSWLDHFFGNDSLRMHRAALPHPPEQLKAGLSALAERLDDSDPQWWDAERTQRFIDELSEINKDRVAALQNARGVAFRTAYRRTRSGKPAWEIRADDIAGCLRTARGGSSKQAIVRLGRGSCMVRWMTEREYARLMGADQYVIGPQIRRNQALGGFGDAVCVPAVRWLASHYLMPVLRKDLNEPPSSTKCWHRHAFTGERPESRSPLAAEGRGRSMLADEYACQL